MGVMGKVGPLAMVIMQCWDVGYPIPRGYDILLSLAGYHAPLATTHPIRYTTRPNLRQISAHQDRLRICPARFSSTFSLPKQLLPKEAFSYIYIYTHIYNINIYTHIIMSSHC